MERRKNPIDENLKKRVISAAIMAPICILLTIFSPVTFFIMCMVGVIFGLKEWFAMPPVTAQNRKLILVMGTSAIFFPMVLAIFADFYAAFPTFIFLVMTFFLYVRFVGQGKNTVFFTAGLIYLGLPLCLLVWLRSIEAVGLWVVLYIYAVTWGSDTIAYFIGKKFGKRPLAPSISPGKTWEGLIGAGLGAIIFGLIVALFVRYGLPSTPARVDLGHVTFLDWPLYVLIPFSFLMGAIGQAGDLLESKIKRLYKLKDSGSLIPGHGGILDRIDALVAISAVLGMVHFISLWL